MKKLVMALSIASLFVPLWAAFAYGNGRLTEGGSNKVLLLASIAWFVTAPFWMGSKTNSQ